jgi:hypothetical protein
MEKIRNLKLETCLTTVKIRNAQRRGVALLVVLFIVMVITILSVGFLSSSDVELACGQNMAVAAQMDYLIDSGLEHAKGLLVEPQDVSGEYWRGDTAQQIVTGNDYYDVAVAEDESDPTDHCTFIVDCNAYRLKGGEVVGLKEVQAKLRLDPCIAYGVNGGTMISQQITANGDIYCAGSLTNLGIVRGDAFADGAIVGAGITGRQSDYIAQSPITWPSVEVSDYRPTYYIGENSYSAYVVSDWYHPSGSFGPSVDNPGGVRCRSTLGLTGGVEIEGTVVVADGLQVSGADNVITPVKNFPALVVGGNLTVRGSLEVNGLAIVKGKVILQSGNTTLDVSGGLFVEQGIFEQAADTMDGSRNATLYNGPTWRPTGGQEGGALEFDGVDDFCRTADSSTKLQLTGDYTLSVWVKANESQKDWAGIIVRCDPTGTTDHWGLQVDASNPKRILVCHPTDRWDTGITLNEIAGAWHHIGVVRDVNQMTAYLDGVPRNSGAWSIAQGSGNGHFIIGAAKGCSSDSVYSGLIDTVRIYGLALSADQVYPPRWLSGISVAGWWQLNEEGADVVITAEPSKAAIRVWSAGGIIKEQWESVGGAFFKSIARR